MMVALLAAVFAFIGAICAISGGTIEGAIFTVGGGIMLAIQERGA